MNLTLRPAPVVIIVHMSAFQSRQSTTVQSVHKLQITSSRQHLQRSTSTVSPTSAQITRPMAVTIPAPT